MKTSNLFLLIPVVLGLSSVSELHAQVCIDAETGESFEYSEGCEVNNSRNRPCRGTQGNDVIKGTYYNDVIVGLGGNDRIHGDAGDDLICAADGADRLEGGDENDNLMGGRNNDRLYGGYGDDYMDGGPGTDDSCSEGSGTNRGTENCP